MPLDSRFASERFCRRVLLIGDILIFSSAFALVPFLLPSSDFRIAMEAEPGTAIASLGVAILCALAVLQLTRLRSGYSWFERMQQISLSLGTVFLVEAFLSYVGFAWLLEMPETFLGSVLAAAMLVVWYFIFRIVFPRFPAQPRLLLLGSDVAFPEIAGARGYQMLGPMPFPGDIRAMANEWLPDEIVVGDVASPGAFPANALLDLRFQGVRILDAATFFEAALQRVSCLHLAPVRFLYGDMAPQRKNLALQAIYSNFLGLAALVLAAPVLLCAAVALKVSAPSEPLLEPFRAIGLHGIPFDRLLFQSRSPFGRWLARVRMRGLPQLFNVVRGEMSLVGPRPTRVEFNEALGRQIPYFSQRVAVRPGLTGWAQIHGATLDKTIATMFDASVELEYDLYYIKNLSPSFDIDILLASIVGSIAG